MTLCDDAKARDAMTPCVDDAPGEDTMPMCGLVLVSASVGMEGRPRQDAEKREGSVGARGQENGELHSDISLCGVKLG